MSRRLFAALLGFCVGLTLSVSAAARPGSPDTARVVPRGWWPGSIVVEGEWDQIDDDSRLGYRGTATLKITRTEPGTAAYELEYAQETRWLDVAANGECRGKLRHRQRSSWKQTVEVRVVISEVFGGIRFYMQPRLPAPLTGQEFRDCSTGEGWPEYDAGDLNLDFGFTSKQPASAVTRRGSDTLATNLFAPFYKPRPGGVNTVTATWDLRLVKVAAPAGAPKRFRFEPELSSVQPLDLRRGTTVRVILGKPRLVDAAGETVATSGDSGCDVTYFYNSSRGKVSLSKAAIRGSWSPARLLCTWKIPRTGAVARAIATKNVHIGIAPWIIHQGKRHWAYDRGDHFVFLPQASRR